VSIKIRVEASGIIVQAQLRDEALPEVIGLVQRSRIEDAPLAPSEPASPVTSSQPADTEASVREWLKKHSPAEALNLLRWESYADKILLLAATHEARGGGEGWRSADMDKLFAGAKERPPANFPRDIRIAIRLGDIRTVTPRTYAVSRTGWNKLGDALNRANAI
jgi:hypothetical protein